MPKTKFHRSGEELSGDVIISGSLDGPWKPGYLGNAEYIAIPPGDFILNQAASTARDQSRTVELGISLTSGGTLQKPSTNSAVPGADGLFAIKIIPKGFRAYAAIIHGVDTSTVSRWAAYSATIVDAGSTQIVTGPPFPVVNVQTAFTQTISGDGITYVVLGWNRGHRSQSSLFGAQIFIEPIV